MAIEANKGNHFRMYESKEEAEKWLLMGGGSETSSDSELKTKKKSKNHGKLILHNQSRYNYLYHLFYR